MGHDGIAGRERVHFAWLLIFAAGSILGLRLVQLQIMQGSEYSLAAERNRTHMIYQNAPRGRIYDRHGVLVATNQPSFSLIYLPSGKRHDPGQLSRLAEDLAYELRLRPADLLETLQEAARQETAVRLSENLSQQAMFRLSELKTIYPGIDLIVEARRYYPMGRFASHLLGYMGKMDARSWKELKNKGYNIDSHIGRLGLEALFERELKGKDGGIQMEMDAQGRLKRVLAQIPWQPGSNVYLTIDAELQKRAEEGLRGSPTGRGAVIVLDPRDGAILALASAPDFDPNALLASAPGGREQAQLPEFNHAVSGVYPPGSIFKLVVGAAALSGTRWDTEDSVFCPGYFELGRNIFLCWQAKGHKKVAWRMGLAQSCDVYFYTMGLKVGADAIEKYSRAFGLGAKTHIALKGEKSGNIFGPAARRAERRAWYEGDTVNLSIGQGELLVTPIQMAVMVSAIANKGSLMRPHYTDRIVYADGQPDYKQKPEKLGGVTLKPRVWDELFEAMRLAVSSGTSTAASIPGLAVFGKTGTAQNPGKEHAWFISFAGRPGEKPSVAVAVVIENGGHGATAAAPIAREIFLSAFDLRPKPKAALKARSAAQGGGHA